MSNGREREREIRRGSNSRTTRDVGWLATAVNLGSAITNGCCEASTPSGCCQRVAARQARRVHVVNLLCMRPSGCCQTRQTQRGCNTRTHVRGMKDVYQKRNTQARTRVESRRAAVSCLHPTGNAAHFDGSSSASPPWPPWPLLAALPAGRVLIWIVPSVELSSETVREARLQKLRHREG
jgi:hypothetical protein